MVKEQDIKYFTQIPYWVDELEDINDFQARLLGYIYTFENITGSAFPSNAAIAERFHKSPKTVQNSLSDLYKKGYLASEKIYKDNSKLIEKRYLKVVDPHILKCVPYARKNDYPMPEKVTGNRLINRLTNNNAHHEDALLSDFEKLWKLYPRKKNKSGGFKAYKKAIKDGATNKEIQDGIVKLKKEIAYKGTELKHVPYGSTWLNNKRWQDEYEIGDSKPQANNYKANEIARLENELQDDKLDPIERNFMSKKLAELKGSA